MKAYVYADIIESWTPVEDITRMPKDQLCSYCYGAKLKIMQQSPYSVYDGFYEERLKYVIQSEFIMLYLPDFIY